MPKVLKNVQPIGPTIPVGGQNQLDVVINEFFAKVDITREKFDAIAEVYYTKLYPTSEPRARECTDRLLGSLLRGKMTFANTVSTFRVMELVIKRIILETEKINNKAFNSAAIDYKNFMIRVRNELQTALNALRKTYEPTAAITIGTIRIVSQFDATSSFSINIHPVDSRTTKPPYQLLVKPVKDEAGVVWVESVKTAQPNGAEFHYKVDITSISSSKFINILADYITKIS